MSAKCNILPFLIFFLFQPLIFSQIIELRGKVVKVAEGRAEGVPNISVKIVGESVDVTKPDGSFRLNIPADKEYVTILLENCPHPMIDPYAGRVNLPYPGDLNIRVCAVENEKLRAKVDALGGRVKQLEKGRQLDKRQLERLHQTMLDTILFYENQVENLSGELEKQNIQLAEKQLKIEELERKVASLEQQLLVALQEKYLQQKEQFDNISSGLNEYLDQLKNLRDMVLPERVSTYFLNPGAREELYKVIENYNAARNRILNEGDNNVVGVANQWSDPALADELEAIYKYLLNDVHTKGIYPLEFSVNDNLKQFLSKQKGRTAASKDAKDGAEKALPNLAPYITALEEKTQQIIRLLKENF